MHVTIWTDSIEVIEVHSRKVQATARALGHHGVGHFFSFSTEQPSLPL